MESCDPETVRLTPEQARFVRAQVESGRYANAASVVGQGLRMLREMEEFIEANKEGIRRKIEEGLAEADRGELIDGDEFFAELERMDAEEDAAERQKKRPA
jgi:antitoxin ParD1/3/4